MPYLITLRSNDQRNTTVYGYEDGFGSILRARMLMNVQNMVGLGIDRRDGVVMKIAVGDRIARRMAGFIARRYIPPAAAQSRHRE